MIDFELPIIRKFPHPEKNPCSMTVIIFDINQYRAKPDGKVKAKNPNIIGNMNNMIFCCCCC
jgi:hypothetical protein